MVPALEISSLAFTRPRGFTLDVDHLTLEPGAQLLLEGPSGCGKSTLLMLAAGLLDPVQGSIKVDGLEIGHLRGGERDEIRAQRIGMVFQTHHLIAGLSARENVALPMLFAGVAAADQRSRADSLLEGLGLSDPTARVDRLSVGQQQRVAIARAIATRPTIVLADEPTAALDPVHAATAIELLQRVCTESEAALLITSHDPSLRGRFDTVTDFNDVAQTSEATV